MSAGNQEWYWDCLVLVQQRKTHPDMTEKLFTGWRNKSSINKHFGSRFWTDSSVKSTKFSEVIFMWFQVEIKHCPIFAHLHDVEPLTRGHLIQKWVGCTLWILQRQSADNISRQKVNSKSATYNLQQTTISNFAAFKAWYFMRFSWNIIPYFFKI